MPPRATALTPARSISTVVRMKPAQPPGLRQLLLTTKMYDVAGAVGTLHSVPCSEELLGVPFDACIYAARPHAGAACGAGQLPGSNLHAKM